MHFKSMNIYQDAKNKWIFAAIASITALPCMLKTIYFFGEKIALSNGLIITTNMLCLLISVLFAFMVFINNDKETIKDKIITALPGGLYWLTLILSSIMMDWLFGFIRGIITGHITSTILSGVLIWITMIVCCIIPAYLIYCLVLIYVKKKIRLIPCSNLKQWLLLGITLVWYAVSHYFLTVIISWFVEEISSGTASSMRTMLTYILLAIAKWLIVIPMMNLVAKLYSKYDKEITEDEEIIEDKETLNATEDKAKDVKTKEAKATENKDNSNKKCKLEDLTSYILAGASLVIFIVISVITGCTSKESIPESFKEGYRTRINNAMSNMLLTDYITGHKEYADVTAELDAWECIFTSDEENDKSADLQKLCTDNPNNIMLQLIYIDKFVTKDKLFEYEKLYINRKTNAASYAMFLLEEYDKADKLTKEQKNRRAEILDYFAGIEQYSSDKIYMAKDYEPYADKLQETITYLRAFDSSFDYTKFYAKIQLNGGVTDKDMSEAIDTANANPDDMVWQIITIRMFQDYDGYIEMDGAKVDKLLEIVENCKRLYKNKYEESFSDDAKVAYCEDICSALLSCGKYDMCKEFAIEALKENCSSQLYENALYSCIVQKDAENCYQTANSYLQMYSENLKTIYYKGIAAMMHGMIDEAVDCALKIAEYAVSDEDGTDADSLLFSYLSYMLISKDEGYRVIYACYDQLTDEQLMKLESNEFLKNYIIAYQGAFKGVTQSSVEKEDAIAAIDKLVKTRADIAYPYYMLGAIHTAEGEYEDARDAYIESVRYEHEDAMIWYALAITYETLEDYENAYSYCLIVEQIAGTSKSHIDDWYGVSLHNQELKNGILASME